MTEISREARQAGNRLAGWMADRCSVSQQLGALQTHSSLFLTQRKYPFFKFRCNIFIGVRIIKEMPGSVASGTHGINLAILSVVKKTLKEIKIYGLYVPAFFIIGLG
jgi:hypothetical protein